MCGAPRDAQRGWHDPIQRVSNSLPRALGQGEWLQAVQIRSQWDPPLARAGAACAFLWSKNKVFRMIQNVILKDEKSVLERCMPFIRCLNSFILEQNVRTASIPNCAAISFQKLRVTQSAAVSCAAAAVSPRGCVPNVADDGRAVWEAGA